MFSITKHACIPQLHWLPAYPGWPSIICSLPAYSSYILISAFQKISDTGMSMILGYADIQAARHAHNPLPTSTNTHHLLTMVPICAWDSTTTVRSINIGLFTFSSSSRRPRQYTRRRRNSTHLVLQKIPPIRAAWRPPRQYRRILPAHKSTYLFV